MLDPKQLIERTKEWMHSRQGHKVASVSILGAIAFAGIGMGVAWGTWQRACLGGACPSIRVLDEYRAVESTKIYAADGRLIADLGQERRTVLRLEEMAPALRAAFVAIEDKRFYEHNGIDYRRVAGAVIANARCLCMSEGFSTLTMQLARNVFPRNLPSTKTIDRKVREIHVALELERTFDKDRILELYLNQIFLGGSLYGVEAAAQSFFGKSAGDLNVSESAILAAVANIPNTYNPRRYPDRVIRRRNLVLNMMRDEGFLSPEEAEYWKGYPLELSTGNDRVGQVAPYFVEWIRQELYARFGQRLYERGFRVYTTLDLDMQEAAERNLAAQLDSIESEDGYNHMTYQEYLEQDGAQRTNTPYLQGALIAMDVDSGYVRALVGGRDFEHSEFNRATQALRQPGSSFKAFLYSAAIRAGKPPSYIIDDSPVSLDQPGDSVPWEPVNFEGDFLGPMTMREGLFRSRNLVAINLGLELGTTAVQGEAKFYGISSPIPNVPSMVIGAASVYPIEMVSAYSTFASLGSRATPIGILRVEDEQGNIVLEPQPRTEHLLEPEQAWLMNNMMKDVVNRGSGVRVRWGGFNHPAGGKTGTTNDGRDVWFIGFTKELVAGVWIGLDQPQRITSSPSGGRLAVPAWTMFMNDVYRSRPSPGDWDRPANLVTRQIDRRTGYLATEDCPEPDKYYDWFLPGTEPREYCPVHTRRYNRFSSSIIRFLGGGADDEHAGH